jgi:hypothetical protein
VISWYIFHRFGILCQEKSGHPVPWARPLRLGGVVFSQLVLEICGSKIYDPKMSPVFQPCRMHFFFKNVLVLFILGESLCHLQRSPDKFLLSEMDVKEDRHLPHFYLIFNFKKIAPKMFRFLSYL